MASLSLRMLNARREPLDDTADVNVTRVHASFDVHEILLFHQHLDPGYALVV